MHHVNSANTSLYQANILEQHVIRRRHHDFEAVLRLVGV